MKNVMKIKQRDRGRQLFLLFAGVLTLVLCLYALPQNAKAEMSIITSKGKAGAVLALSPSKNLRSLILSNNQSEHYLSPYLVQYEDQGDSLGVEQIVSSQHLRVRRTSTSGSITTVQTEGHNVWLGFDVMNRSDQDHWKLDFGSSFMGRFGLLDEVEVYTLDKESGEITKNQSLNEEGIIHLNLPLDKKSQIIMKVRGAKGVPLTIPLRLLHEDKKVSTQSNKTLLISCILLIGFAFFYGAIALLKFNQNYLFFSAYYSFLTLLLIIQNNYIDITWPVIGSHIIPLLLLMASLSGLMIARLFWNMEDSSRFANMAFLSFIGLSVCSFLGGMFLPLDYPVINACLLFGPSLLIMIFIPLVSIAQSQQGNNEATPFMFGWFILLFGTSISILALSEVMQPVSTAINAFWYTLIPQALFFIFATKMKLNIEATDTTMSKMVEITETDSIARLRQSKENTEQERLLKVIEQERRVLGELRKSEARRTEEMRKAKEEADIANKAKSAFLAVVSHEIRTPMTGIMGMVRLLLDSNLTKEQKEYAQTIQDSSDAMLALLNDILDFEKIEQGKMVFENISFDLHRLVQGVSTLMNGHATQKGIELRTKIGKDLPRYVKGDPTRLRQVLLNLTGNAVKFTSEGHVTITAELMKRDTEAGEYEIYLGVTDSGIGIPKSAQKDLFSPFSQADSSISRKFGGTGLGLAISKGLVHGMGSAININSNEGEGSTFFFTIKMQSGDSAESEEQQGEGSKAPVVRPMQILVLDDNNINQKVIKGFLEKQPHTLTMANDANDALEKIKQGKFDLALMDIELPGMNGDELTEKIRQTGDAAYKDLPIIALTGNAMPQDIERYYSAGMNGVLAKPIDAEKLISTITKAGQGIFDNPLSGAKTQPKPATATPPPPPPKPAQAAEPPPIAAPDAVEDYDISRPATPAPTPVAPPPAATPLPGSQENKLMPPLQMNGNMSKLELESDEEEEEDKIEIFNPSTLETLKGHISQDDIQEMLDDVNQKTEEIISAMNDALKKDDKTTLSAKGHELKGMAGNFGLVEISQQAAEIERKAKSEPIIVLTSLVLPLPEMQKRAKEALDHWVTQE